MAKLPLILVVEDTAELREDLALELTEAGYSVCEAQDGSDALARLGEGMPRLIICDIQLPKADGLEFVAKVRETLDCGSQLPVIFMSAFSDHGLRERARLLDISHFLVKPIDYDALLGLIARVLAKPGGRPDAE